MHLTTIQYDAIMQAIDNYKYMISHEGIADCEEGYTSETIGKALEQVENMIISDYLPY